MTEPTMKDGAAAPELRDALESLTLRPDTLARCADVAAIACGIRDELRKRKADADMNALVVAAALVCNTANRSHCAEMLATQIYNFGGRR